MMPNTLTLTSKRAVPIQGNFAGANVVAGTKYSFLLRTHHGTEVIGQVTSQTFSTAKRFVATVWLDAGTYAIGDRGTIGDVYIVDEDGDCNAHGASSVTSTLNFGLDGLVEHQVSGARG